MSAAPGDNLVGTGFAVTVTHDEVYGQGVVDASIAPRRRALTMDVYRPVLDGEPLSGRPAVIMAFGGAFHRGSKGWEPFEEDGASDSPIGA